MGTFSFSPLGSVRMLSSALSLSHLLWSVLSACLKLCLFVQFPIGPGSEGPLGAMAGMDPLHLNGGNAVGLCGYTAQKLISLLLVMLS